MYDQYTGHRLKRDLYNNYGTMVISKETKLTSLHIDLIQKHNISLLEMDIEAIEVNLEEKNLISRAAMEIHDIFSKIKTEQQVPIEDVEKQILPTIFHVAENPNLFHILLGLQTKDDYTYRHNIGVAVFSNMIGKWLHLDLDVINELTLAATLHDIGKINIPDHILNKPGKFTSDEYEVIKKHAVYGYEILKKNPDISESVALVALEHHERGDGSGYPNGTTRENMNDFSKIVAIADIFHALTTNRVYRNAMPFYKVMAIMREEGFGKLDSKICSLFIQRMMEMTVGCNARLTDGRVGRVIMINPIVPECPLIEIGTQYLDLNIERKVQIEVLM